MFAEKVLGVVKKIPKGKVSTYKAIASAAGKKGAARAVGMILKNNKDLRIPCYRVIKSNGRIGGYSLGVKRKIRLLMADGIEIKTKKNKGIIDKIIDKKYFFTP